MARPRNIVILTGAGISAESGVPTFRAADGLWEGHRVEDVATPQAYARDPALVQAFYDARRAYLAQVKPNLAHRALARLDREWPGGLLLVTQNVDDLHERGGSRRLIHMHGELKRAWCRACDARRGWEAGLGDAPVCPGCGVRGRMRPDIVWFGEMPYEMDRIEAAIGACDLFVSIGTSGAVYPAAGFVAWAGAARARTLEINLEPTGGGFDETRAGRAGELVLVWVDEMLGKSGDR